MRDHFLPCVYILTNKPNGTIYIGVTSHLVQRVFQHREGLVDGFTKTYGLKALVWYEVHSTMESAITREKAMKEWKRQWKIARIRDMNPAWIDLYPTLL
ncbi:MAG: GIY-YIG nuclease family protein [Casimicrobium sp.]